jgi:hypothetical protein
LKEIQNIFFTTHSSASCPFLGSTSMVPAVVSLAAQLQYSLTIEMGSILITLQNVSGRD